jgi:hypothetical protein
MLKHWGWPLIALALVGTSLLALTSCSGAGGLPQTSAPGNALPPPEDDLGAPGMIPAECEALLQKSKEWQYQPGGKWTPNSPARAEEAVRFFGSFHFVPRASSEFYRALLAAPAPRTTQEAEPVAAKLGRAQNCEAFLANTFLEGLIAYPWPAELRPVAQASLFQFVLNQQARVMPLMPRLMVLELYRKALAKGLARGNAAQVQAVIAEGKRNWEKMRLKDAPLGQPPATPTPVDQLRLTREELEISQTLREKIARHLPLP